MLLVYKTNYDVSCHRDRIRSYSLINKVLCSFRSRLSISRFDFFIHQFCYVFIGLCL
jgi:hypothetical protein